MSNKTLYQNICARHPELPVFMQPWWLNRVCPQWDAAIVVQGDLVKGLWPYPVERKMGVGLLRTLMLTPYLGPIVFFPPDMKESNRDGYEYETLHELLQQVPAAPVWFLGLQPGLRQAGLFQRHGLLPQVQQTFRLSLQADETVLLGNMKDTLRRNIRQAGKDLEIVAAPEQLKDLFHFYKATLQKKNKATFYSLAQLEQLLEDCLANDAGTIWVAREGGKLLAIVWQVWDAGCSYYLLGAQNPAENGYKAMSALLWHCMKHARGRGITTFDLEGSMDEGVERFFRGFGGQRELFLVLVKNTSWLWKLKQLVKG